MSARGGASRMLAALAASACAALTPAYADEPVGLLVGLGVDSTGVFRGTKSDKLNPSVYGFAELSKGQFYGGAFSNPVHINGKAGPLVLGYAGFAPSAFGIDFDVGGRVYAFPGSDPISWDLNGDGAAEHVGRLRVFESYAAATKPFEGGQFSARLFWSPDSLGDTGTAWYYNAELRKDLIFGIEARGQGGLSRFADDRYNEDYADWSVGLFGAVKSFDVFVRYSDTVGLPGRDDSVVVVGVERSFNFPSTRADPYEKVRNRFVVDKSLLAGVRR